MLTVIQGRKKENTETIKRNEQVQFTSKRSSNTIRCISEMVVGHVRVRIITPCISAQLSPYSHILLPSVSASKKASGHQRSLSLSLR